MARKRCQDGPRYDTYVNDSSRNLETRSCNVDETRPIISSLSVTTQHSKIPSSNKSQRSLSPSSVEVFDPKGICMKPNDGQISGLKVEKSRSTSPTTYIYSENLNKDATNISKDNESLLSPLKGQTVSSAITGGRLTQTPQHMMADDSKAQKKVATRLARQQVPKRLERKLKMPLFSHLVQIERNVNLGDNISLSHSSIHPCFITLGLQCADQLVFDSKERCSRLIECLKMFVKDYITPPTKELSRDFESKLSPSLSFLVQCRPLSAGMGTIIKFFKLKFYELLSLSEIEIKKELIFFLNKFLHERIHLAGEAIATILCHKIVNYDVVLTYSMSDIILKALISSSRQNKQIKVIVADSKPRFDGLKMIKKLVANQIQCAYIGFNGLPVAIKEVTKVIIGASTVFANGAIMSPVGSAMIVMMGSTLNIPVLVCCETFNYSERAQTDAFVYNELGDPDDLITSTPKNPDLIERWKDYPNVTLLNLYYDIIQPKYVTAVVTEVGVIPCSSAPVVLRVKN